MDLPRLSSTLNLLLIQLSKVTTGVGVSQKTLKKLADRVLNAKSSFLIETTELYTRDPRILLVDDAVGFGATINTLVGMLKQKYDQDVDIYGFALVGSFKGFDVISQV